MYSEEHSYTDGNYINNCEYCGVAFKGKKNAFYCKPCTTFSRVPWYIPPTQEEIAKIINDILNPPRPKEIITAAQLYKDTNGVK